MKKNNKKNYQFGKKNYGNTIVAMKFSGVTFQEIRINGTREEKIKRLMTWFDEETATEITEQSLTKFPAFMVEG